jgi:hypothetical protein
MPRQNYNHARKQKEATRKARQQEKRQRRSTRLNTAEADIGTASTPQEPEGSREPSPEART